MTFIRPPWLQYQEQMSLKQGWNGKLQICLHDQQRPSGELLPGLELLADTVWARRFVKNAAVTIKVSPSVPSLPNPPLTMAVILGDFGFFLARVGVSLDSELEREVKVEGDQGHAYSLLLPSKIHYPC